MRKKIVKIVKQCVNLIFEMSMKQKVMYQTRFIFRKKMW